YLSEIESPSNHTISGIQLWPVKGGTVVSMSIGGSWLTLMNCPTTHLWSVALQLFEAVMFMHEHNVTHMDLKLQNIIIPSQGGHVPIIDFSVLICIWGPNVKYSGVVGTEYYMVPEVQKGEYKPILADLWSCRRTLEEFCLLC
ncbi:kinase-like domain-containing protein, partial [Lanmaoa asiatica]